MGISWSSNNNRRRNNYYQNPHPPSQLISSSSYPSEPYPAPPPPFAYPEHPPLQPPLPPPPPPPLQGSMYSPNAQFYPGGAVSLNYHNHLIGRSNFIPYYGYQNNGWVGLRPPHMLAPPPPPPPPVYVEHQETKKVQNDVNVRKDTLRLEVDEENPDHHLVSFVFDALFDGSITILYFAKEESKCRFVPVQPEVYAPVKVNFQKGHSQRFCQPSGTGIDFGFFDSTDLSKPSSENVYPLVISAETLLQTSEDGVSIDNMDPHMQITLAVVEKNEGEGLKVRVLKQILWIDGVRYELRELYGIGNSSEEINDSESGKECVICMTEPKDTAALPCRHMCMCRECAKALRLQSNKCPICRQPIEELMEIMVHDEDQ